MAEKKKLGTRKPTAKSSRKSKPASAGSDVLEQISEKLSALAAEAEGVLKDLGATSKKTARNAGHALEGAKDKAGELASHLPVVGDGDKPKKSAAKKPAAKASASDKPTAKAKTSAATKPKSAASKSANGTKKKAASAAKKA